LIRTKRTPKTRGQLQLSAVTDHLDLWQIHEVVYWNDPELIFAPSGAAEALLAAKQQGKVRFIGFTGHKNPAIH
jgi:predicted aldo/keto reductase-like oxidoreductase